MHTLRASVAALALGALPLSAHAQGTTLVNTFGPGNTYKAAGLVIGGTLTPPGDGLLAEPFTLAGSNYNLSQIDAAFAYDPNLGGANSLELAVETSEANGLPSNSILESFQFSNLNNYSAGGSLLNVVSAAHPELLAHHTYWLVAASGNSDHMIWMQSPQSVPLTQPSAAFHTRFSGWQLESEGEKGAYRVYGTPAIPESSTLVSFGLLLSLGGVIIARRKIQPKQTETLDQS